MLVTGTLKEHVFFFKLGLLQYVKLAYDYIVNEGFMFEGSFTQSELFGLFGLQVNFTRSISSCSFRVKSFRCLSLWAFFLGSN